MSIGTTMRPKRGKAVDEYALVRSVCRESFWDFVQEFWSIVVAEPPVWNWHMEYLCNELQDVAERVFKRKRKLYDWIANVPPATSKSTIASIMFPSWCWTRMPECRTIGASYSGELARDLARKNRDVVKSEKYMKCFPEVRVREDQDAKGYFANTRGGDRFSAGVGGTVTGMHGHFVIVDDPLNPNEALSEAELKAANNWMGQTIPSRKVDKVYCPTLTIMQRLHQNDPTGNRLEKLDAGPVRHISLPAELVEDQRGVVGGNVKPNFLKENYADGLLDPKRLPRDVLKQQHAELGEFGYSGQYLQDPVPLGGGMFEVNKLRYGVRPQARMFTRLIRFWDKAGTMGGGAYTVGVLMGLHVDKSYWVLDVIRGQWGSAERERIIRQTARFDGRGVRVAVEQEPGSGGKDSAEGTVRGLAGFRAGVLKVGKSEGDKALRADPFSVQVNFGNVFLVSAPWNAAYVEELRYFPYSKYKDQADASSGAFAMHTKPRQRVGGLW